jgi:uncharacterized protein YkwD
VILAVLAGVLMAFASATGPGAPAAAASVSRPCPGAGLMPSAANIRAIDAATLCLINRVRAANHVPGLRANRELRRVAAGQVSLMVRWDYFSDVRPTGQTPLSLVAATRYPLRAAGVSVGQNIAWGISGSATPASIVASWLQSPPHREIMLSGEFHDAGVASTPAIPSIVGRGAGATYAIVFGVRWR